MTSSIAAAFFFRNPCSACVGFPSASYAAFFGGPLTSTVRSSSRSASPCSANAILRGVLLMHTSAPANAAASRCRSVADAASCIQAGISSVSSSKKYSAMRGPQQREAQLLALGEELLRAGDGEVAHALDHRD